MTSQLPDNKRIFAAGFYAGMQAAGVPTISGITVKEYQNMMNRTKFNKTYAEMTSVAQKVYDAVPIAECWNLKNIISEMHRLGTSSEYRVIAGCLNTLINAGLVKEPKKGEFIRAPIRDAKPVITTPAPFEPLPVAIVQSIKPAEESMKTTSTLSIASTNKAPTQPKQSPMDKIGALALRFTRLSEELKAVAMELSEAAVDIQGDFEASAIDAEQLKQFKSLMKSFATSEAA